MNPAREVPSDIVKTDDVIGVDVKNPQGENLGEIEEIILDKIEGTVRYVVLSFGGFLSMGDKLFALPWKAISFDPEDECFILNIDKDKLKSAPGFDKDHWPNFSDKQLGEKIYSFYGSKPYWD